MASLSPAARSSPKGTGSVCGSSSSSAPSRRPGRKLRRTRPKRPCSRPRPDVLVHSQAAGAAAPDRADDLGQPQARPAAAGPLRRPARRDAGGADRRDNDALADAASGSHRVPRARDPRLNLAQRPDPSGRGAGAGHRGDRGMKKRLASLAALAALALPQTAMAAQAAVPGALDRAFSTMSGAGGEPLSLSLQLLLVMGLLTILPALILMITSFTRIIVVLAILRKALGLQQSPPNLVLIGLSLFLSLFVMAPTLERVNDAAI